MPTVEHPLFSRVWSWAMRHEPRDVVRARGELLQGLSGRVLEVGAGTGSNFAHYPETVTEIVAIEPDRLLREEATVVAAARETAVPGTRIHVRDGTFEALPADAAGPFDAVVCSLVLCSVADVPGSLASAYAALRPGGQLRYYEHVATDGWLGGLQRTVDATFWPRAFGGCHTHRDTVGAIDRAGFERIQHRDIRGAPRWAPVPISPLALGIAQRPA
ncbi:Methyltransferase [Patulibacter medicamentivorans]|uniref:Methyltransferase n=1 Tax=Patulibacter medicamentivorans TaxID=1097667 RepID=H0E464_9ACTN|nr:class I SAM-dependent methyltransferase [Patulibacter medicamentivorans]EHN11531.1 Methyltransferase [Patulibacter medicamentivorans]